MTTTRAQAAPSQSAQADARARFEALYEAHYEQVYRRALRYGAGRRDWAEDVAQEVFMTMMSHLDRLDPTRDAWPWLGRVTTNTSLKRLRREALWRHKLMPRWLSQQRLSDGLDPQVRAELRQELQSLYEAVHALPPKERVAVLLHRVDGLTLEEVGRELGHSKGYVSKLVQRADAALLQARRGPHER